MIKSEIQLVRSLGDKRTRSEMGLFIAEGDKLIEEILNSQFKVRKLYLSSTSTLEDYASSHAVEFVDDKEMERISQLKTANASLALVEIPRQTLDVKALGDKLSIILDGVQNPGNLGTIIRLADWFGIENIICSPACAECYNPKVIQATMGAILRVKVHYAPLEKVIEELKSEGAPIFGTLLEGGENIYEKTFDASKGAIVLGSEGSGISSPIAALLDYRLFIPPFPADNQAGESLNVAIAAAIVCAEFRRPNFVDQM